MIVLVLHVEPEGRELTSAHALLTELLYHRRAPTLDELNEIGAALRLPATFEIREVDRETLNEEQRGALRMLGPARAESIDGQDRSGWPRSGRHG